MYTSQGTRILHREFRPDSLAGGPLLEVRLYIAVRGQIASLYQGDKRIVAESHQSCRLRTYLLDDR